MVRLKLDIRTAKVVGSLIAFTYVWGHSYGNRIPLIVSSHMETRWVTHNEAKYHNNTNKKTFKFNPTPQRAINLNNDWYDIICTVHVVAFYRWNKTQPRRDRGAKVYNGSPWNALYVVISGPLPPALVLEHGQVITPLPSHKAQSFTHALCVMTP